MNIKTGEAEGHRNFHVVQVIERRREKRGDKLPAHARNPFPAACQLSRLGRMIYTRMAPSNQYQVVRLAYVCC